MNLLTQKMAMIADLKRMVINHSQFEKSYEKLLNAYRMNVETGVAEHIICVGQSGTGKSTLKEKIRESINVIPNEKKVITPILIINTPALPTVKNLAEEMLLKLGDFRFYSGSTIQKTTRIHYFLQMCEVKMIIFDELQHFIDRATERKTHEVADWLKTVIDQSKCSVVLMGLERCEYLFRVNEQLRRRFSKRVDIYPFSINSQESIMEFMGVIVAILDKVEMTSRFDLRNRELISAIHYATDGVIANLIKLFIGVVDIVDPHSNQLIDMKCMESAFTENIWQEGKDTLNPFNKKFIWQRLNKPGMPFHKLENWTGKRFEI